VLLPAVVRNAGVIIAPNGGVVLDCLKRGAGITYPALANRCGKRREVLLAASVMKE
jgi:hypothetical protein